MAIAAGEIVTQTVHLFVFDTFADWETGFATAGINYPEFQAQSERYQIKTVGLALDPVITIRGVTVLPDLALSQVEFSVILILPEGETWDESKNGEILDLANDLPRCKS
jgi:hypothetical protein